MKKFLVLLLCGMTSLCMACGSSDVSKTDDVQEVVSDEDEEIEDDEDDKEEEESNQKEDKSDVNEEDSDDASADKADKNDSADDSIDLNTIYEDISSNVELVSPMLASNDYIYNYYGVDTSVMSDYFFVISEDPTSAETIIVAKAVSDSDVEAIKASLETVLFEKGIEMENYLPAEYEYIKNEEVSVKGDYVILVISHNADAIKSIINNYL